MLLPITFYLKANKTKTSVQIQFSDNFFFIEIFYQITLIVLKQSFDTNSLHSVFFMSLVTNAHYGSFQHDSKHVVKHFISRQNNNK